MAAIDDYDIHMQLRAVLEGVAEIPDPIYRAWNSVNFEPDPTQPDIASDYVPGPRPILTTIKHGVIDATGLYVIRYYGLANEGEAPIWEVVRGIMAAFPIGPLVALQSGNALRVRGGLNEIAPSTSQILPMGKNKSRCLITIPWRCVAINVVAA